MAYNSIYLHSDFTPLQISLNGNFFLSNSNKMGNDNDKLEAKNVVTNSKSKNLSHLLVILVVSVPPKGVGVILGA